jgi:serine/threonine-protein kinase HipA
VSYSVFFRHERVGTLVPERARVGYAYAPATVAIGGPALSVRLPVRADAYAHDEADPFFSNLLPEEEYRRLLARVLGVSGRNVAGLLGAIGGECAGAVSIWPEGQRPPDLPEYVPLADKDIRQLFDATNVAARLQLVREGRLSLAGGMEKLGLRRLDNRWQRGRAGAPTTHILKWAPPSLPDLNYNELFCQILLREAGLPVVDAAIEGTETPVLIVPRYDRIVQADDSVLLVHQEDFCQATGTEPGQKYQAEGGPGFAVCAEVLRRYAGVPAREILLLVRWAIANFVIGNCDAHGKNVALLYAADGLRLAPFYDLASTLVYPRTHLRPKLAMAIGGEYRIRYIYDRHWERFARDIAVPFRAVRSDALGLADAIEDALPRTRVGLIERHGDQPVFKTITRVVTDQIARLRANLTPAGVPSPRARGA